VIQAVIVARRAPARKLLGQKTLKALRPKEICAFKNWPDEGED